MRDARKPGINSIAERAVALIAAQEIKRTLPPNLIFRRTCFGDYNRSTNVFAVGTPCDMASPECLHMAQIPCWDIQTIATDVPSSDPNLVPAIPLYDRGTNVLVAGVAPDGFRESSKITVFSFGCDLRFVLDRNVLAPLARREDVTVRYAIVAISSPDAFQLQWAPTPQEALPYKGLGYSSRLDTLVNDDVNDTRRRILKQGKIVMKYNAFNTQERFRHLFWKGKLPYEYQSYSTSAGTSMDQNGQRCVSKWKVFLVIRSDSPTVEPLTNKVRVNGFIKCGYKNYT